MGKYDATTLTGWVNGSWWKTPVSIRHARALADVNAGSIHIMTSYSSGRWYYRVTMPEHIQAWFCRAVGITNPKEALTTPEADDAVDPHAPHRER